MFLPLGRLICTLAVPPLGFWLLFNELAGNVRSMAFAGNIEDRSFKGIRTCTGILREIHCRSFEANPWLRREVGSSALAIDTFDKASK